MLFKSEEETVVQALERAKVFYTETADKCEYDAVTCRSKVVELTATIATLTPAATDAEAPAA